MSDKNAKAPAAGEPPAPHGASNQEKRKAHRFRVRWHADVVFPNQSAHSGFINDISIQGTSVFLGESPVADEAELHIHIPPLDRVSKPHIVVIHGKMVYAVFDGDRQMFRAAYVFSRFRQEADRAYLEGRLSKYQLEIQDPVHHNIVEL